MVDGITFFLTYPRFDAAHDTVVDALRAVGPIVWARVAVEQHSDGGKHIHVCVRFGARVRGGCRIFDIGGHHPNIQSPRRIRDVLKYICKDSNFIDFGEVPGNRCDVYDKLKEAASGGDREAFDRIALEARVSFQWAQHIWGTHTSSLGVVLAPGSGAECMQLQSLSFGGQCDLIVGPSGCGKTTWAKRVCPKPALFVSHLDHLGNFNAKVHKCIIFDDVDFKHLPRTSQIHLVDFFDDRQIHIRYKIVHIPAGTPKIFTANDYPFTRDEAIARRLKTTNIISLVL